MAPSLCRMACLATRYHTTGYACTQDASAPTRWHPGIVGQVIGFQWLPNVGGDTHGTAIGCGKGTIDDSLCQEGMIATAVEFLLPYRACASKAADPGLDFEMVLQDGSHFVLHKDIGRH